MGDRGNIYMKQHDGREQRPGIYLYSHWGGTELPQILQAALRCGHERWRDEQYLTRIIFCAMIGSANVRETTGFGISTYPCDNEWPLLVVDCERQRVSVSPFPYAGEGREIKALSFDDFCALSEEELAGLRTGD